MTVTYFVGTAIIFKEELKNVTCNTTLIDKNDEMTMITEYLNKTVPNFKVSNVKTVPNSSIKNDGATIMVTEYIKKTIPNFKLGVIVPVVNAIVGSQATLICSGNYDQQFCVFTSPIGTTYNLSTNNNSFENGRITRVDTNAKDCGIEIGKVIPNDNGVWQCHVHAAAKNKEQYYQVDNDEIILRTFYDEDLHEN